MTVTVREHFRLMARYNADVNRRMLAIVEKVPAEKRSEPSGSFHGSIMGILNHVLVGDTMWLRRFRDWVTQSKVLQNPALDPSGLEWGKELYSELGQLTQQRGIIDSIFSDWIEELPEERYSETISYVNFRKQQVSYVFWMALDHVFNHQTHHRGQISHVLDELGVENDYSNILSIL